MLTKPPAVLPKESEKCSSILAYLDEVAKHHGAFNTTTDLRHSVNLAGESHANSPLGGSRRRRRDSVVQQYQQQYRQPKWREEYINDEDDAGGQRSVAGAEGRGDLQAVSRVSRAPRDASKRTSGGNATTVEGAATKGIDERRQGSRRSVECTRAADDAALSTKISHHNRNNSSSASSNVDGRRTTNATTNTTATTTPDRRHCSVGDSGGDMDTNDKDETRHAYLSTLNEYGSIDKDGDEVLEPSHDIDGAGGSERRRQRWIWDEWDTSDASSFQRVEERNTTSRMKVRVGGGSSSGGSGGRGSAKKENDRGIGGNSLASCHPSSTATLESRAIGSSNSYRDVFSSIIERGGGEQTAKQAFEDVQATARSMKEELGRHRSEASVRI